PLAHLPVPAADVVWFVLCAGALLAGCWLLGVRDPLGLVAIAGCATCVRSFQVGSLNTLLFLALALMWRYRETTWADATTFTVLVGSKVFLLPLALWLLLT